MKRHVDLCSGIGGFVDSNGLNYQARYYFATPMIGVAVC